MEASPSHRVVEDYSDMPPLIAETDLQSSPRSTSGDPDPGAQSDGSLPSLQTVSDSSDDGEQESEDDEDDDDYVTDEDDSSADDLPPLVVPSDDERAFRNHLRAVFADELRFGGIIPPETLSMNPELDSDYDDDDLDPPFTSRSPAGPRDRVMRTAMDLTVLEHALATRDARGVALGDYNLPSLIRHLPTAATFREIFDVQPAQPDHDHVRAETIISSLEVVPEELICRYEKLRSGSEGVGGEDQSDGCAICRDAFISEEPIILPKPRKGSASAYFAELPFDKMRISAILAFPCPGMHLFHENCIFPWLARKTTCPTCRFDIDPDSLTLRLDRQSQHSHGRNSREGAPARPRRLWEPPKTRGFVSWLRREEDKSNGIPVSPIPSPPSAIVASSSWIPHYAFDSDADDEDDEEEWITDEEDMNRYYAPYLMPMPPTPDMPISSSGVSSDSDSDDEGPPPLIGENEDGLPVHPIPNPTLQIVRPSPLRTLHAPQDEEVNDDSDDDLPPLVGEDRRRPSQRPPGQPRDTSGPEPRGFSIINELMSVIGGFPAFSSGGGGSNFYQAR